MTRSRRPLRFTTILLTLTMAFGLAACSSSSDSSSEGSKPAPQLADPSRAGERLIRQWLGALQRSDSKAIAGFLAPNFQIQRADGTASNRSEYLANPAKVSSFTLGPEIVGLQHDDTLSVRWSVEIDEIIDGKPLSKGNAPRLTGFHWNGERWQIVTYANFNLPAPS